MRQGHRIRRLVASLTAVAVASPVALLTTSLAIVACAPLPPGGATGSMDGVGAGGGARERVQVGSFAAIEAVAVSRRFVYVAANDGVAVYDRFAERWMPPATRDLERELGYALPAGMAGAPATNRITVMAGDPVEEAVWIGVPGAVLTYRPFTAQVQRTLVVGVPQRIVFERAGVGSGDALVFSGGQWTRISRVGLATTVPGAPSASQVLVPPTLGDLLTRYPTLRAQPQLLMRTALPNRPRRAFGLTAGAASPDRANELWLGTNGDGLFRFDPAFGRGDRLPYGLLDPGAGALAPAANGLWIAGLGLAAGRGGLTFATSDLQRFRWVEGTIAVPLGGARTFSLATRGDRAWLATDRGLVRVTLDSAYDMMAYTRLAGLPDDRVFAVAPRDDGAWAGTARGLVFVADDRPLGQAGIVVPRRETDRAGPGPDRLAGMAVYALQITGTTLWAGTSTGLVRLPADPDVPGAIFKSAADPGLRRAVRALAATDSGLLVATDDAVFRVSGGGSDTYAVERMVLFDPPMVGEVTRLAADARSLALAGRDGVLVRSRTSGALRALRVPADLPGPALDVLLQRDWLFVATPQGLVRFRRTGDGLVP